MNNKETKFAQMLEEACRLAKVNGNRLTKDFVAQYFEEMELSQDQLEFVYAYFAEKKIQVVEKLEDNAGDVTKSGDIRTAFMDENTIRELCEKIVAGEKGLTNHLVGLFLDRVVEIAEGFENEAMPMEDLIQEGNLGLLMGIQDLSEKQEELSYEKFLEEKVYDAIMAAVKEEYEAECADEELENRVNELHKKILSLSEELERKPSLEEVSLYTKMPVEEVKSLFRMMGEEVEE